MNSPTGLEIAPGLPEAQPSRSGEPQVGDELTKLHVLHQCGALSEVEFIRAKNMVLDGQPAGRSAREAYLDVRRRPNWLQRFTRSPRDYWAAGLCGALGERTPLPSWCWRLLFCATMIAYGTGFLVYIVLWIFVPLEKTAEDVPTEDAAPA